MLAGACLVACTSDEITEVPVPADISFRTSVSEQTRAVPFTTSTLESFESTAFVGSSALYEGVVFNISANGTYQSQKKCYWPADDQQQVSFYAFAPLTTASNSQLQKDDHHTFTVTPSADDNEQIDLIVAKTEKTHAETLAGSSPQVPLNFRHAESLISLKVVNSNPDFSFKISAAKLVYLDKSAKFTYDSVTLPHISSNTGSSNNTLSGNCWTDNTSASSEYQVTLSQDNTRPTDDFYTFQHFEGMQISGKSETPQQIGSDMILIPQTTFAATKYYMGNDTEITTQNHKRVILNGSYIALKMSICNAAGDVILAKEQWCCALVSFNWEPGKHYTYILDLAGGGYKETPGQDDNSENPDPENPNPRPVFDTGKEISFTVTVDEWVAGAITPVSI